MRKTLLALIFTGFQVFVFSQDLIEVTDQTIKISGEEDLYYGFTKGDEVELYLREVNGKDLKEVEVLLYPDKTVYSSFKVDELTKTIRITEEGVYQFRFKHSGMGSRICQIHIQRKPSELTQNFDTTVDWVERIDTIFKVNTQNVIIGYEEKQIQRSRKIVAGVDTTLKTIISRTERVHSSLNVNGNTSWIPFSIPETVHEPNFLTPYKTTEVVSWAYAITTGEAGQVWYKDGNKRAIATNAVKGLVATGAVATGYGALAVLAIEGVNLFSNPPKGENVRFELITSVEGVNRKIAQGNSVVALDRMTQYLSGNYAIQLKNDNVVDAINADVNVIAVLVTTTYKDQYYTETKQVPIKEKQVVKTVKSTEVVKMPIIRRD